MSFGELRIPGLPGLCCVVLGEWRDVLFLADGVLGVLSVAACRSGFGWGFTGRGLG